MSCWSGQPWAPGVPAAGRRPWCRSSGWPVGAPPTTLVVPLALGSRAIRRVTQLDRQFSCFPLWRRDLRDRRDASGGVPAVAGWPGWLRRVGSVFVGGIDEPGRERVELHIDACRPRRRVLSAVREFAVAGQDAVEFVGELAKLLVRQRDAWAGANRGSAAAVGAGLRESPEQRKLLRTVPNAVCKRLLLSWSDWVD